MTPPASPNSTRNQSDLWKNPIVLLLVGALTGGTGIRLTVDDDDRFRGEDGRRMLEYVENRFDEAEAHSEERHKAQQAQIDALRQSQALDDQHRSDSPGRFKRIRDCEAATAALEARLAADEAELRRLREDVRDAGSRP